MARDGRENSPGRANRLDDSAGKMRPEVRWVIGIVVGLTALVGLLILVFLIVLALEPPDWLQVVMGVVLVAVAVLLTWLVASALGERSARRDASGPKIDVVRDRSTRSRVDAD